MLLWPNAMVDDDNDQPEVSLLFTVAKCYNHEELI
jgi:hypothetical protein